MSELGRIPPGLDPSTPNVARIYDYWLGGKDNFQADRDFAEEILAIEPSARYMARENRAFLGRAVRFLSEQAGIRQFIDIGTGLPTQRNVHHVAQDYDLGARVVYVDNDEVVTIHANALLGDRQNVIAIQADLRDPAGILSHPELLKLIDLDQPVAVLLLAILHFVTDDEDPPGLIARFRSAMAPGSHLAISCSTADADPERAAAITRRYSQASAPAVLRPGDAILRFFDGFRLLDPGRLVFTPEWRPPEPVTVDPRKAWMLAGVGVKA